MVLLILRLAIKTMVNMNLKTIEIKGIDGATKEVDFDYKGLANYIFNKTTDIGGLEVARELYKSGSIELNKENATLLKSYIKECFGAVVQEALFPVLNKEIDK